MYVCAYVCRRVRLYVCMDGWMDGAASGLLEVGTLAQDIHAMPGSGQSYDEAILDGTEAEDVLGVAWPGY